MRLLVPILILIGLFVGCGSPDLPKKTGQRSLQEHVDYLARHMSVEEKLARIQSIVPTASSNAAPIDFYSVIELLGRPDDAWEIGDCSEMVLTYTAGKPFTVLFRGCRPVGKVKDIVAGRLGGSPPFTNKVDIIIRHDLLEASTPEERAHWKNTGQ